MKHAIGIVLTIAYIAAMVFAARFLDKRWRAKHPQEKPFVWGYLQALWFFPLGLLWFVPLLFSTEASWEYWLGLTIYGVIGSFAGYALITKKKKWAWIFVVIAQMNPFIWFIDSVYGSNRWDDFR